MDETAKAPVSMPLLLKLEQLGLFLLALYFYVVLPYSWWIVLLLFLTPDLGMIGYLVNTRTGAITYNLVHHQGICVIVLLAGLVTATPPATLAGAIMLGHSSFDRLFGYGLKLPDSFKKTHLGDIG